MTSSSTEPKTIRVLDPDLPLLASEAAVDIDNIISDRGVELAAIHSLAEMLSNSIEFKPPNGFTRSLMDPATETMLGTAMAKVLGKSSPSELKHLLREASSIASELLSDEPTKDYEKLAKARDFCMTLSKTAVAYNKSIRDLRPSHPYRR